MRRVEGRGRKLRFTVRIGDVALTRELTWNEVARLKELVKEFCKWDPGEKCWIARVDDVLKYVNLAASALSEAFGDRGEEAVKRIVELDRELREREAEKGVLLVLPESFIEDYRAYRLLRRCAEPSPRRLAGAEVRYYALDPEAAVRCLLEWGFEPEELKETLLDLLQEIDPSLTEGQVRLVEKVAGLGASADAVILRDCGPSGALIMFPRPLTEAERARLEELCSLDYYQQRVAEGEVELVPTRLSLLKPLSSKVFLAPYFAARLVEEFAREIGLRVEDCIEWPEERIEIFKRDFRLYRFQEEALEAWMRAGMRGTIVMPTGAGKTFVAMAAIAELRLPTLICVTTVELAKQWARRLRECLGIEAGILAGGEKRVGEVTVATYHSAARSLGELYDKYGLVVYDEGHHLPAETFKEIAFRVKARYTMVLSATPERADKNEMLIFKAAGEPVYVTSYLDLVLRGVLAPLKLERVYVELESDEAAEYSAIAGEGGERDLRRTSELIKVASRARRKLEAVKEIVKGEEGKIIIFCQYVDQAEAAYKAVRLVEPRCALITGSTSKGRRLRALEDFKRGSVRVLVTTTVLDEGVDVPDADVAVILSGTGQARQMVQRVGRVLRWTPGKVAKVYEVVAKGTIEEALSRSRSVYKLFDYREVRAALELATRAYERMGELIRQYRDALPGLRRDLLEKARAEYVKLVVELARTSSLRLH
ncbi:MAG: hypothetical protein DRJ57_01025 [Thermoprotei archaeon]|nr:MAG: hypothetical protein DRJ57_01025 [Thermoprotei archaeon]